MVTHVPQRREVVPLTAMQIDLLHKNGILYSNNFNAGASFVKLDANYLTGDTALRITAWTPTQLRLMADIIESNATVSLCADGSGRRLDDPLDIEIDYDLPNWQNR